MRCMECGKEMQFTTAPMTETYRGEKITVKGIEHYVCECGNDEMTAAEATKLAHALAAQYAKAHELLSPSEIKHLRSDLGLTQHELVTIRGFEAHGLSLGERRIATIYYCQYPYEAHSRCS